MAEITWKNVEGPSPAAGLAALGAAAETLDKGFTPLHQIIKDHEAQAAQHWDAQKDINTRDMLAKIQSTQDLGELNEARDSGRLNESAMVDRFGAQIDTAGMNSAIMNQRDILRNKLQKELISEGLAAADKSEDLAVGAKSIRDSILARGGHVDFAQTAAGQFMEGNKDRANLYAKAKQDRLSSELAAIDPKSLNGFADVSALVREMAKSGKKVDLAAYAEGAEKILANKWVEENRKISAEDRKDEKAHKALMLKLQLEDRDRALAREKKALDDEALAKRLAYSSKLYGEYSGQGADFIAKERADLAGANGFAPEQIKYMETVAAKGGDLFEGFNKDASNLTRDMLNKAKSKLMNGTFESGPNKGKRFNFNEKEANLIVALAAKEMQGLKDVNGFKWGRGESKADNTLTKLIQDIAPRYRQFKNDSAALDKVATSFAERDRTFQSWLAGADAGVPNVKPPTLYPIESDPVVAEYMKRRLGNAGAGNEGGGGGNTGTDVDAQTRANEAKLAGKAATAGASAVVRTPSRTGLPAKDYLISHPTVLVESVPRRKLPDGSWRKLSKEEMDKHVAASRTLKKVGEYENKIKSLQKPLALYNPSPDNTSPEFVARAKRASEEKRIRLLNTLNKELKVLYRKPF